LQHVSSHGGHVAQLRRGGEHKRLGDHRESLHHTGRFGDIAHPRQGSYAQATVRKVLDLVERQRVDVDE
jgi:hypothetical protein